MASDPKKAPSSASRTWLKEAIGEPRVVEMGKLKVGKSGSKSNSVTVRFGSVTLTGDRPNPVEVSDKVKRGQRAFAKAAATLTKPGVKLKHADTVPVYHADPKDPRRVVRVLNGKSESGRFIGAVFKPL